MSIERVPSDFASFSDVVAVDGPGRWIHVAGQVGMDADGKVEGDLATQTHATFDHVERLLGKVGAGMGDVVKITVSDQPRGLRLLQQSPRRALRGGAAGQRRRPGCRPPARRRSRDRDPRLRPGAVSVSVEHRERAGEPIWSPGEEWKRSANVTRLMERAGTADLDELRSRALDPDWLWPAVFEDLGIEFAEPCSRVVDLEDGPEWPRWFPGSRLNLADLCLDRWAAAKGGEEAVVWESERGERRTLTWAALRSTADALARGLGRIGVGEGDTVGLFLPMSPEAVAAFYACAKIGAIVVPLFSGYGAGAVSARILDAEMKVLLTADGFPRGGKIVAMKEVADEAVARAGTDTVVAVWRRLGRDCPENPGDVEWNSLLAGGKEPLGSVEVGPDHPLLLAYTSGTTGRPKGAVLTHAGLVASIAKDAAYHLDLRPDDTICWVTDIGWIMGPWTIVSAGALGARLCLCEGGPTTPDPGRLWRLVEREGVTVLGVSPSLTRA